MGCGEDMSTYVSICYKHTWKARRFARRDVGDAAPLQGAGSDAPAILPLENGDPIP